MDGLQSPKNFPTVSGSLSLASGIPVNAKVPGGSTREAPGPRSITDPSISSWLVLLLITAIRKRGILVIIIDLKLGRGGTSPCSRTAACISARMALLLIRKIITFVIIRLRFGSIRVGPTGIRYCPNLRLTSTDHRIRSLRTSAPRAHQTDLDSENQWIGPGYLPEPEP